MEDSDPRKQYVNAVIRALLARIQEILAARDRHTELLERFEAQLLGTVATQGSVGKAEGWSLQESTNGTAARSFVVFSRNFDGSASFLIDGNLVKLPPLLAATLEHLASPEGKNEDSLVPWKSRTSIRKWLAGRKAGKEIRPQYVNKLMHDLRARLRSAGLDPMLVQSHRQKGVRFAVSLGSRNDHPEVTGGNPQ